MAVWKMALMVLVTIVLMVSNAWGTETYCVDPNGDDDANGLSWATAFATIQKGVSEANDGNSSNYDVIDVNSGTYTEDPINLDSDNNYLRFRFQENVTVQASTAFETPNGGLLFDICSVTGLIFDGNDGVIQMNRSAYTENEIIRHELCLYSCTDVEIRDLTFKDSGGDGIYLGTDSGVATGCENVLIENVVCDNNMRSGISITNADGVTIRNCVLKNANWPRVETESGIFMECNYDYQNLKDINVEGVLIENNEGLGIGINFKHMTSESNDVNIVITDCYITGSHGDGSIAVYEANDNGVDGSVTFRNITVTTGDSWGVTVHHKADVKVSVLFDNCVWKDMGSAKDYVLDMTQYNGLAHPGGVDFNDCQVFDSYDRAAIGSDDRFGSSSINRITGELYVKNDARSGALYDWNGADTNDVTITVSSGIYSGAKVFNETAGTWYSSIDSALTDALDGDIIEVMPGTYSEQVDFDDLECTLRSWKPTDWDVIEATIISASSPAVDLDCNAILEGVTVKGTSGAAISCSAGSPVVKNCIADDTTKGIEVGWYSSATISNCIVRDNANVGIQMNQYYNDVTVENCLTHDNSSSGIYVYGGVGGTGVHTITNCTSVGNSYGINIYNGSATITNCILWNNSDDLNGGSATYSCIEDCNDASGTGNICGDANDPNFIDDANDDYHIAYDSPCINAGNLAVVGDNEVDIDFKERITDTTVDIGADEVPGVHNLTQGIAYETIGEALTNANNGDVIEVIPGTYYEPVDFGGVACTLRSSDPNDWDVVAATVIDGNSTYPVVDMDCNAVLSGLRITGGQSGADVYCTGTAPVISKCIIDGCTHGIYAVSNSSPDISNCKITDTTFGIHISSADADIENSCIYENDVHGIYCYNSQADVNGCTIADNSSNGIYVSGGSAAVTNCIIWDNADDLYGCSATYSCIEDCNDASGTGNICGDANDPNFVNAANDNYHIESDSPCIDAGDPNGTYTGQVDIDFESRVMGDDVEMGADEVDTE